MAKRITKVKDNYYILVKCNIVKIYKLYACNSTASDIKMLTEIKGKLGKPTVIGGHFNSSFSVINRSSTQIYHCGYRFEEHS